MANDHSKSGTFIASGSTRSPASPDRHGNVKIGAAGDAKEQVLYRPESKPHEKGDMSRTADGKPANEAVEREAAKPQPAMPEPAATPPWAAPAEEKPTTKKSDDAVPGAAATK